MLVGAFVATKTGGSVIVDPAQLLPLSSTTMNLHTSESGMLSWRVVMCLPVLYLLLCCGTLRCGHAAAKCAGSPQMKHDD